VEGGGKELRTNGIRDICTVEGRGPGAACYGGENIGGQDNRGCQELPIMGSKG
jgi:hypothetical protein